MPSIGLQTPLKIIYSDDQLMVVDKPANLVVTPSETSSEITLAEILKDQYQLDLDRGGLIHRLDKDTSGIILIAKNEDCLEKMQSQFKERTVEKMYTCLVHGFLDGEGQINAPIMRNPLNREKFVTTGSNDLARDALTFYSPIAKYQMPDSEVGEVFSEFNKIQIRKLYSMDYPKLTLVNCFPKTGRTHQIRVHLKHINHPIVGDDKYGGRKVVRLDHRWCKRQFLHASRIKFKHPTTQAELVFESPLPDDLSTALSRLIKV